MLVYRICKKEEILCIIEDQSLTNVGKQFIPQPRLNNFEYQPEVKYLHFFPNKLDILYLNPNMGTIVCEYCIPDEILKNHEGEGLYLDFINFRQMCYVKEYAIPTALLKFEFLNKVEVLREDFEFEGEYVAEDITQKVLIKSKNSMPIA